MYYLCYNNQNNKQGVSVMISQENIFNEFLLYRSNERNRILLNHFVNKMIKKSDYRNLENNELFSKFISNDNIFYTIVRILREDNKNLTDKAFLDKYFKGDAPNSEKTLYNWIQRSKNFQNGVRTRKTKEVYIEHIRNLPASFKLFNEFLNYKTCRDIIERNFQATERSDTLDLLKSFFKELEPQNLKIIATSITQHSSELPGKKLTLHDIIFIDKIDRIEMDLDTKSWTYLFDELIKTFKNVDASKELNNTSFNKENSLDTIYKFLNILPEYSLFSLSEAISLVFNLKKYLKIELEPKQRNKLPKEIRNKKFLTSNVIHQINDTLQIKIKSPLPHELLINLKDHLLTIIEIEEDREENDDVELMKYAEFSKYMNFREFIDYTEYIEEIEATKS